ncbi:pseudouridine synthase [Marinomonas agarivorans]|nr:pseudouridine synthase [Marinomonas agarivorans]
MRLDYFLSHSAGLSRKLAKQAIAKQRVSVNGHKKLRANSVVSENDTILLDDVLLSFSHERYYAFHKSKGVICATEDSDNPVVFDFLPQDVLKNLKIVGRLDKDTTGLLLLTTDGQWLHQITSPRRHVTKTYLVNLADKITAAEIQQLEQGVQLNGESNLTKPAIVKQHTDKQISLTITEGKYHQVKRMLAAVGNRVDALHRTQIGEFVLPETLKENTFLSLTPEQITQIESC